MSKTKDEWIKFFNTTPAFDEKFEDIKNLFLNNISKIPLKSEYITNDIWRLIHARLLTIISFDVVSIGVNVPKSIVLTPLGYDFKKFLEENNS